MRPVPSDAAPAASTPTSRTSASSTKAANMPIAFEPPPTHATTASGSAPSALEQLLARLAADHRLELAHELGVRRRADARADHVVRRLDVRDPVADRLARRLLQRPRAELDRLDRRAEEAHPLDVGRLPAHVLRAHVDDALEPEAGAGGRRRDAVLAGAGLGDDAALAEPPREHDLAERVVDLVRARVVQVLALEVEALARREARGERDRGGAPDVRAAELVELRREGGVALRLLPGGGELVERRDQRLRDVPPAVGAEGLLDGASSAWPPRRRRARARGP